MTKGTQHVLVVQGRHPARLNDWDGRHWTARHRPKQADRELIGLLARAAQIPAATGKRRVSLRLTLAPRQKAGDPDCYWKSTLDSRTGARLLTDDNRQEVEFGEVSFLRGSTSSTAIVLEDLA